MDPPSYSLLQLCFSCKMKLDLKNAKSNCTNRMELDNQVEKALPYLKTFDFIKCGISDHDFSNISSNLLVLHHPLMAISVMSRVYLHLLSVLSDPSGYKLSTDHVGAMWFTVAVVLVYGVGTIGLLGITSRKNRAMELMDKEVNAYLKGKFSPGGWAESGR